MNWRLLIRHDDTPLSWSEGWRAAAALAVIVLLANLPGFAGTEIAAGADGPRLYYPFYHHAWNILADGDLPTWSNFIGGGFPIMASSQVVMFYPPNWIFGLFRTPVGYNVVTALHLWIVGLGTYALARTQRISPLGALAAALGMIFGASMAARIAAGHIGELYNRAWMPWQLVAITWLARRPGWWRAVLLSVVFGLTLLAGSSGYQIIMYTGILSAVWGAYLLWTEVRGMDRARFVLWCGMAVLLGIALGAVQTLPTADLLAHGNRQEGLAEDDLNVAAMPIPMVLGFIMPHVFDDAGIRDFIWPEFAAYAGTAILFLAFYAMRHRHREPLVRLWLVVITLFFLLSFGLQNPLFRLVLAIFPPYSLVRNPARHLAVVHLGLALLAGMGLDTLLRTPLDAFQRRDVRWRIAMIGVTMLVVLAMGVIHLDTGSDSLSTFPQRVLRGVVWFGAALLAAILALQLVRATRQPWAALLLLGVIGFEMLLYAQPLFYLGREPGHLDYLAAENFPDAPRYYAAFHEEESEEAPKLLHAEDSGMPILNVYSSILPERAVAASNLVAGRPADTYLENHIELVEVARPDLLDMFAVRWVLIEPDQTLFNDDSLQELRDEGVVTVYENTNALPIAYLVPDWVAVNGPDDSITWLEQPDHDFSQIAVIEGEPPAAAQCPTPSADAVDAVPTLDLAGGDVYLTVETAGPRLLVVNQTFVDGWRGWVDGEKTTVYPANHRWLAVYVPCAGTHRVHLQHLPASLQRGTALSLGGLAVLLIAGLIALWRITRRAPKQA